MISKSARDILRIALILMIVALPAMGAKADEGVCNITELNVDGAGRVEIVGDKELNYRLFPLTNPDRLVFDFKGSCLIYNGGRRFEQEPDSQVIGSVRISQFRRDPNVVRLVIEPLTGKPARITRSEQGTKLIVDLGGTYEPVIEIIEGAEVAEIEAQDAPLICEVPFKISQVRGEKFAVDVKIVPRERVKVKRRSLPPRLFIETEEIFGQENLECLGRVSVDSGPVSAYETFVDDDAFRLVLYLNSGADFREEALPDGLRVIAYKHSINDPIRVLSSSDVIEVLDKGEFFFEEDITEEIDISPIAETALEEEIFGEEIVVEAVPEEEIPVVEDTPEVTIIEVEPPEVEIADEEVVEEGTAEEELAIEEVTVEALAMAPPVKRHHQQPMKPKGMKYVEIHPMRPERHFGIDYRMIVGDMRIIRTIGLERVSVGNPEVISVNVISQMELLITALGEGQTALMTWEQGGMKQVKWIEVTANVNLPKKQISDIIGEPNVTTNIVGTTIIIEGTVETDADMERAVKIAESFGEKIVNLIEVLDPKQVMVKVRVVEIDKKAIEDFFHQISAGARAESGDFTFSIISAIIDPEIPGGGLIDASVRPGIVNGDVGDIRYDPIDIALDYLESERKASILSEPNVVALSGTEAKFRVGGEVPYSYVNENGVIVVDFKEFGVELNMTPTVNSHGGIRLLVNPVVRTVDLSLAIGGIPGFRTRTMSTEVQLENNQTIVIGGLIQNEITEVIAKIPLLGDIPILGKIFTSRKFQEDETELLVFLTPSIVERGADLTSFITNSIAPEELEELFE